jgi:hypothetical protein
MPGQANPQSWTIRARPLLCHGPDVESCTQKGGCCARQSHQQNYFIEHHTTRYRTNSARHAYACINAAAVQAPSHFSRDGTLRKYNPDCTQHRQFPSISPNTTGKIVTEQAKYHHLREKAELRFVLFSVLASQLFDPVKGDLLGTDQRPVCLHRADETFLNQMEFANGLPR